MLPDMGEPAAKDILGDNLARLMAESADLKTVVQLHARLVQLGKEVSTGNIDRIRRKAISTSVDNMARLAAAFGLEPWQMLIPGIKANTASDPATETRALASVRQLVRQAIAEEAEARKATGPNVTHLRAAEPEISFQRNREQKDRSTRHATPRKRGKP